MNKLLWIALSIGLSTQLLSATSVTPLSSGKAIDGTVKQKEKKYYNITVPKNKSVRVNLTGLEADVDLYVKKGNEVRVRFNDCYSANSNTENEECVVTNEGETSTYSILVNGFKASSFNLKATIDGAEAIPTLTSDPLADAVEKKEGKQYKLDGKKGETITVTLSDLTADADLRVRVGRKAGLHSFNCKSNNSGTKTEECVITPKKDATVYVHVYGYQASNYSLKAVKGTTTTTPCITREELQRKIYKNEDVTKVNTSCITDMSNLFKKAIDFNQDISNWDVSHVTDMRNMFESAYHFNQNINKWNVSSVTNMSSMFVGAHDFNQNINSWDVSNVTDMSSMFSVFNTCLDFNQDISNWDVSNVTNMRYMFEQNCPNGYNFTNHDLSRWDVKKVTKHDGFFNEDNTNNIEPKWKDGNINSTVINKAKIHCLNRDNSTDDVLCSLEEDLVYILSKEDGDDVIHTISTKDWTNLNKKIISVNYAPAQSLNKLENTNLFYVKFGHSSHSYFNFYYFVNNNITKVLEWENDSNFFTIDTLKTISNGNKLLIENHNGGGDKFRLLYDISNLPNIEAIDK